MALNLLVDPLGAYRAVSLAAFAPYRAPQANRQAKAELIARGGCETLLLGSSRVLVGLPVDLPSYHSSNVYNLALSGTTLTETTGVLDFSLRHNPLRRVVIGLDFHMFSEAREAKSAFATSRFNPHLDLVEYHGRNLFGSQALGDSWGMLWQKLRRRPPALGERGWVPKSIPRNTSQRELFIQRIQDALVNPGSDTGYRPSPERLEIFREMVRRCRRDQVELILFIPPVHALEMEALHAVGLWPEFERWKTDLLRIVAEEGGADSVPLWDFTGFTGPVAEPLPSPEDRVTRMKYYLEVSHFTPALGRAVVARMLGDPASLPADMAGFGVRLTSATLPAHLAGLRTNREAFAAANPEEVALVARLAAAAKGRKSANVAEF